MLERAAVADVPEPGLGTGPAVSPLAVAVTACVAAITLVAPTLLGAPASTATIAIPMFVIGAGILFGLGLSDLVRSRDSCFGRAVVAAGALWCLSALAASSEPAWYSVGRVSYWLVSAALVYLLLSYPSGRLTASFDRVVFAAALIVVMLYLPTVLVAARFPSPSVWSLCASDCPANPFALGHSTPALVQDVVVPMREVLTVALFLAVPAAVWRHRRIAGPLLRQMYLPIIVIAVFSVVTFAVFFALRRAAPSSTALHVVMWVNVLSLPAVAAACVAGRMYRRLLAAKALERVAHDLRGSVTAMQVTRALADALEDRSLRILHAFPGEAEGWVDESGAPATPSDARADQDVTDVVGGRWRIAIVHDSALAEDRALVQTAGSYALAALENEHLSGELLSSLEDLAESRAHGVAAEYRARNKLERDLHDGAQQRLVALRLKLSLLEEDDPARAEAIHALGEDIDATIDEVRSFARGVYPSLLTHLGLAEALRAAGRSSALPTSVRADGLGRYPPELEATVYFFCSEALQNAAKHARGATRVTIVLSADRDVRFEIRDDGAGFDVQTTPFGTGLSNLRDRLAAVGGTMTIRSTPAQGTTIQGSLPLQ
jgi:signal transduction histidine kinase